MNGSSDLCRPGPVRQFLQSWGTRNVSPRGYPLTLADAQEHADAFVRAAETKGISRDQIQSAIHVADLREVMVARMRESVEGVLFEVSPQPIVKATKSRGT